MTSDNLGEIQEIQLSWWKNFIYIIKCISFFAVHTLVIAQ